MNLKIIVMALFGLSSCLDIAEKIHNWGRTDKKEEKKEQEEPSPV